MTSLTIRNARVEDIDEIYRIEVKSFKIPYPRHYLKILLRMAPQYFLVAEENGKVVGYISGVARISKIGHIVSIAVDPDYRRRGIGNLLIEALLKKFKNDKMKKVRLEVRVSNKPAINLYVKIGFKIERRIKNYYPDGEDCFVMTKEL